MNENKEHFDWIDGLKGIACLGVFIGHYFSIFLTFSNVGQTEMSDTLKTIFIPFRALYNGDFYVYVFAMLIGFLAGQKNIETFKEFINVVVLRYLRFAIMLVVLSIFCLIISIWPKIYLHEYSILLDNSWIDGEYVVNIKNILKTIFLFDNSLSGPLWVFPTLFWGAVAVYLIIFLTKSSTNHIIIPLFLGIGLSFFSIFYYNAIYLSCCVFGYIIIYLYMAKDFNKDSSKKWIVLFFIWYILLNFKAHSKAIDYFGKIFCISTKRFSNNTRWYLIYTISFLIIIVNSQWIKCFLSKNAFKIIGKISTEIYFCHYPITLAFGLPIFFKIYKSLNYDFAFIITLIITTLIVLTLSYFFNKTSRKSISNFLNKVRNLL